MRDALIGFIWLFFLLALCRYAKGTTWKPLLLRGSPWLWGLAILAGTYAWMFPILRLGLLNTHQMDALWIASAILSAFTVECSLRLLRLILRARAHYDGRHYRQT